MQCRMCATAHSSLAMVTYLRRDGWGETGLVYEDRDDVAPDLGIGDASYAITRTAHFSADRRTELCQLV